MKSKQLLDKQRSVSWEETDVNAAKNKFSILQIFDNEFVCVIYR